MYSVEQGVQPRDRTFRHWIKLRAKHSANPGTIHQVARAFPEKMQKTVPSGTQPLTRLSFQFIGDDKRSSSIFPGILNLAEGHRLELVVRRCPYVTIEGHIPGSRA